MANKTYQQIQAEIDRLQKEAAAVRQTEVAEVVAKIKSAIDAYGLTAADLGFGKETGRPRKPGAKSASSRPVSKTSKSARPPKYRDGEGNTWSGMGKRPGWFVAALAAGLKPEALLVR